MWYNDKQQWIINHKLNPKSNWVRDELIFSASDNDDAPDSPIPLRMECDTMTNNSQSSLNHKLAPRSNWVRDELTFSASDNDDAPDEPILLLMECDTMTNNTQS